MHRIVIILTLVLGGLPSSALAQTPPPLPGCTSNESRQFDFWLGVWEVFPKAQPSVKVADSLIEKLYSGCAVRENWMPLKGGSGGSLNAWVASEQVWRQTWLDSAGQFADFKGGLRGNSMVIQGVWPQPGHPDQITRMTYTPWPDGTVEQMGESSDDGGKTWQASFDLIYRHPVKNQPPR